jgi:hypothetical protein
VFYTANANRASSVPVTVSTRKESKSLKMDQRKAPAVGNYAALGTFNADAGTGLRVTISNADTNGHVIVDAVQFVPVTGDENPKVE